MISLKIDTNFQNKLKSSITGLLTYCQKNNWAGYDPYDALNSKLFDALPFLDFKLFRLGLTQLLKRSPINVRPLLLIPKTQNPKAIALFLMAFLKLKKAGLLQDENLIPLMIQKLIDLRSPHVPSSSASKPVSSDQASQLPSFPASQPCGSEPSYYSWGYSFPWQTRTILVPRFAPNLVCTSFVANALLDAYEMNNESQSLDMALSAAEYILEELYWEDNSGAVGFAYPVPSLKAKVHNANFLGAALLCRAFTMSGNKKFLAPALTAARYSAGKQHDDGSWDYGEASTQQWVDNFHTGYNLCALRDIGRYGETDEFEPHIRKGFEFYLKNFFLKNGAPKYFHNRTYPVDVHSVAQSIITLLTLKDYDTSSAQLAHAVFTWAMTTMHDTHGFFYYQAYPLFRIKISYMRWSQAWMLYALSILAQALYSEGFTSSR
jgi:hypothetical protein